MHENAMTDSRESRNRFSLLKPSISTHSLLLIETAASRGAERYTRAAVSGRRAGFRFFEEMKGNYGTHFSRWDSGVRLWYRRCSRGAFIGPFSVFRTSAFFKILLTDTRALKSFFPLRSVRSSPEPPSILRDHSMASQPVHD